MNVRYDHITVFIARPRNAGETGGASANELLQLRRTATEYLGGTWQTVRGTIEAGETALQTALREMKEETGLSPSELYSLGIVETFYIAAQDTVWHSPAFLAIVPSDAAVTLDREHDDFRWIDAADAPGEFMWPSERPLLEIIRDCLLGDAPAKSFLRIDL